MNTKNNKNKENKTKELYQKLVDGIQNIVSSGEYAKFLKFCKNFTNYSFNNLVLIYSQMEDATYVAGFKKWESLGRKIKKGAKGIQIMYPIKRTYTTKLKGQESLLEENKEKQKEKIVEYLTYRPTYVYDVSQTIGNDNFFDDKRLKTNNKKELFDFLKSYSPYPVLEQEIYRKSFRVLE